MKHFTEAELIAYQLHESSDASRITGHLEQCADCAALSESIAETLRVFSGEPVPQVDIEHAWQRLRGSLPALAPPSRPRSRPLFVWIASTACALLLLAFFGLPHARKSLQPAVVTLKPGPLSEQPTNVQIANHLDSAERLLTEVNHAQGPLDDTTREQAHQLLVSNAVYIQQAQSRGDLAQATVLENLGRVLTTLGHTQPAEAPGLHLRVEMHTDGLLLDLRILHQNDNSGHQNDTQSTPQKDAQ